MGAIQRDGYTFDVEYSVTHQRAAVHVYQNGVFLKEIPFEFTGKEPDPQDIDRMVDQFFIEEEKEG
ncbi:hypothetical protein JOD43_000614 [Pullulanibacillus pueri]|uniref:Uncharacterized protein n=1 Tax=Pullulanibacillus pueri TaxID=1437324 RepID=A0A8J2ZRV0_9BACL|nr:DUF5370 family protein [Pullulanibacillus pueri]MBM7680455.1 hypothetical protein [Pullulanibacillus pueri]GGH75003.1 hypothetical protein GCM10007096_03770 [Pullulanibacillus pueri]